MDKVIVFDLGGVLLDWDPRYLYRKIFSDQDEMEYFLREICSPAWNHQMDAGKPFQDAVEELQDVHPAYGDQIEAFNTRWVEMVRGEIPGTVEILSELKDAGHSLAALSNWSAETFPRIQNEYPFLGWFDPLVLSGEVGVAKPAPEIYKTLLSHLNKEASDCLFVDDMPWNIEAADKLGFDTVLFKSAGNLRENLVLKGILDN